MSRNKELTSGAKCLMAACLMCFNEEDTQELIVQKFGCALNKWLESEMDFKNWYFSLNLPDYKDMERLYDYYVNIA